MSNSFDLANAVMSYAEPYVPPNAAMHQRNVTISFPKERLMCRARFSCISKGPTLRKV